MSYFRQRALSGVSTEIPSRIPQRYVRTLGSLGDDSGTTLSQPTLIDPATSAWQQQVIDQLQAGVKTMQAAELQKWLQIAATVAIPVLGLAWKAVFPHLFRKPPAPVT